MDRQCILTTPPGYRKNPHSDMNHQCCHSVSSIGPNKAIFGQSSCHRQRQCTAHLFWTKKEDALIMSTIYIVAVCQWLNHFDFPPLESHYHSYLTKAAQFYVLDSSTCKLLGECLFICYSVLHVSPTVKKNSFPNLRNLMKNKLVLVPISTIVNHRVSSATI